MSLREVISLSPTKASSQEILMDKLISSFGKPYWETTQYWVNNEGEFRMWMEDPAKTKMIEYCDHGGKSEGGSVSINFWDKDELKFVFTQIAGKTRIENHIEVAPFKDDYFEPGWNHGVHYWSDGWMSPVRNVKGLPRKIDTEATVKAFVEQVIQGKFGKPLLIGSE